MITLTAIGTEDLLKTIVIQLFILSMISERITNFIKLNLQTLIERYGSRSLGNRFGNLRNVELSKDKEKQRERGILNWSIVIGIIVANLTSADFFYLISDGDLQKEWFLSSFLGYCLTGFFISLGSKFWHDLLDIVLYTSNLKRKLSDPRTNDIESTNELKDFLSFNNKQIRSLAISQNPKIFNNNDILYQTHSTRIIDGKPIDCIAIFIKKGSKITLPDKLKINLPKSGYETYVPVYTIEINDIPRVSLGSGEISNDNDSFVGSSCCLLEKDDRIYLLTCCHLFTEGSFIEDLKQFEDSTPEILVSEDSNRIGNIAFADMDSFFDVALIDVTDDEHNYAIDLKKISVETDYHVGKKVLFQSIHTNEGSFGFITSILPKEQEVPIQFANRVQSMKHLIEISTDLTGFGVSPTSLGDSGGLVYDEDFNAIGMILAISSRHTYAIPLNDIVNKFQTKLFQNTI